MRKLLQQFKKIVFFDTETTGLDPEKDQIIEHYGLADKVQNSHRAIDDVLALYEVTKAMSEERDDLTDYIDLLGYNPKYGITGRKLRQITYMPQSYKLGCRLPDLMNGGGSCE